ncbi:MAG: hypothetical protein IIW13_04155 [Paludibacteraceae bacterium]|nr:hypothetical protein [Paludibacteraceae bacterium]MBQ5779163.1 hypothetical protein [Paludibacteraceae bacterium]
MKKILISICLTLATLVSVAQNSEHLKFKGVPINGTLSEFVKKMQNAGFSFIGNEDGTSFLRGDFAGFKGCIIGVSTIKNVNVVNSIGVIFPMRETWSDLESDYNQLKSMLTQKYGEPANVIETFQGLLINSNDDKLRDLEYDRCTYQTTFETKNGDIQLSLEKGDSFQYFVLLKYFDKINTQTVENAAIDDL